MGVLARGPGRVGRGEAFWHAEGRALSRARAQRHHAQRGAIRHVRAGAHRTSHPTAHHAHHLDEPCVSLGKCLAFEVDLRTGGEGGEVDQQIRTLPRSQRQYGAPWLHTSL